MSTTQRRDSSRTSNSTPTAGAKVSLATAGKPQKSPPSHEAIALKAYEIWLARGQEQGRDQQHWLEAELQLNRA